MLRQTSPLSTPPQFPLLTDINAVNTVFDQLYESLPGIIQYIETWRHTIQPIPALNQALTQFQKKLKDFIQTLEGYQQNLGVMNYVERFERYQAINHVYQAICHRMTRYQQGQEYKKNNEIQKLNDWVKAYQTDIETLNVNVEDFLKSEKLAAILPAQSEHPKMDSEPSLLEDKQPEEKASKNEDVKRSVFNKSAKSLRDSKEAKKAVELFQNHHQSQEEFLGTEMTEITKIKDKEFLSLPRDILNLIISCLQIGDRMQLRLVSRILLTIVDEIYYPREVFQKIAKEKNGISFFMLGDRYSNSHVFQQFLKKGDVQAVSCILERHPDFLNLLFKIEIDKFVFTDIYDNMSPLALAILNERIDLAKFLIKHGDNLNCFIHIEKKILKRGLYFEDDADLSQLSLVVNDRNKTMISLICLATLEWAIKNNEKCNANTFDNIRTRLFEYIDYPFFTDYLDKLHKFRQTLTPGLSNEQIKVLKEKCTDIKNSLENSHESSMKMVIRK